jgi:hypothetical protein
MCWRASQRWIVYRMSSSSPIIFRLLYNDTNTSLHVGFGGENMAAWWFSNDVTATLLNEISGVQFFLHDYMLMVMWIV